MQDYELNIISRHAKFAGETLVKHRLNGVDTIGVWGEEPFEIEFKNNTNRRVQVRLSLDGTDLLTTEQASLQPSGKMWVVEAFKTLNLSAWPETTEKGARFVFGKTVNSVAANTHGDLSNKGVVAAAVFVESYTAPIYRFYDGFLGESTDNVTKGIVRSKSFQVDTNFSNRAAGSLESCNYDSDLTEISEGPAIGAGETITQKIASVQGLRQPRFDRVISLKYVWYDELKAMMRKQTPGFVVNTARIASELEPQKLANLGQTPRIDTRSLIIVC